MSRPNPIISKVWCHPNSNDPRGRIHYIIDGRHLYADRGSALHRVLAPYAKNPPVQKAGQSRA